MPAQAPAAPADRPDTAATPGELQGAGPADTLAQAAERAQALQCGAIRVAIPFSWARNVVESFDVSPAPNAPAWLMGAVNVDGHILPVLDLSAWVDDSAPQAIERSSRLLVGGEGESQFALLFQGLPSLARYTPGPCDVQVPQALQPLVLAQTWSGAPGAAKSCPVIDIRTLGELWVAELAV